MPNLSIDNQLVMQSTLSCLPDQKKSVEILAFFMPIGEPDKPKATSRKNV